MNWEALGFTLFFLFFFLGSGIGLYGMIEDKENLVDIGGYMIVVTVCLFIIIVIPYIIYLAWTDPTFFS